MADSRAGATLLARELYDDLKEQGLRMKQGLKMRLLQLTGEAKCQGYVSINLYFQLQLGYIRLKEVEAYVLKGLTVPLLLGEDVQTAWCLHTMRQEESIYWLVGNSEHWIPLRNQMRPAIAYVACQKQEPRQRSKPTGMGKLRTFQEETVAVRSIKLVAVSGAYDSNSGD